MSRRKRGLILRIALHAVLIGGVIIFAYPLLWMAAMSAKSDDEVTSTDWLPRLPMFVAHSPYVLDAVEVPKPLGVSDQQWQTGRARLAQITSAAIDQKLTAMDTAAMGIARDRYRDAAVTVVLSRLIPRLAADLWTTDPAALEAAYREKLSGEVLDAALDDRLAKLEIRGLLLRTLDAEIVELCNARDAAARWVVESGDAKIQRDAGGHAFVRYSFAGGDDSPVVLRFDFKCPVQAAKLHKLVLSYVADDSWHRVQVRLDLWSSGPEGPAWTGWSSARDVPLAQHRAGSFLVQPPSFEDASYLPRNWIPMKPLAASRIDEHSPGMSALRLVVHPSSTPRAIFEKARYNYGRAFRQVQFWQYVGNSALLVALSVLGTAFSSAFVAYAFARLHWPGRSVALLLLLSTMMLPGQVTMIPSFMIWRKLGWYNTLNPLWVPSFFGVAFFIFLMIQFMKTIPRELEEAARIDGLNAVQTWYYVILPLVKPALAAIAIMTAIGAWNEFMEPLIYLRDPARFPLSLGLFGIRADMVAGGNDWSMLMAGNILMVLPVVAVFVVFQKYFVQGMTMSGMKA